MSQFNNHTATIVTSTVFENLQYSVFSNGYSREVMAETNELITDRAYSPVDLFPLVVAGDGKELTNMQVTANHHAQLARVGTMYEGAKFLEDAKNPDPYSRALVLDLFHTSSLETVKSAAASLRLLALWKAEEGAPLTRYTLILNDETITEVCCTPKHLEKWILPNLKRNFKGEWFTIRQGLQLNTAYQTDLIRYARNILSKTAKNRQNFTLPDDNGDQLPVVGLEYYKWMTDNKITDHNNIGTRKAYIKSLGYNQGLHYLTEQQISRLKMTLDFHFRNTMLDSKGNLIKAGK